MLFTAISAYYIQSSLLKYTIPEHTIIESFDMNMNGWLLELNSHLVLGTKVYKGSIKNHVSSKVQLVQHSDHVSGIIDDGEDQYRLDALDTMNGHLRKMVLYKSSAMPGEDIPCSTGAHQIPQIRNKMQRLAKRQNAGKACSMMLLADASFIQQFGKDAQSKMIEAIQIASDIYSQNFNVKLEPKDVKLLSDAQLAINGAQSIAGVLSALSREQSSGAYGAGTSPEKFCLSHLFTAKNFGSTTGLAYAAKTAMNVVGGICDGAGRASFNIGVSTSRLGSGSLNMNSWHATVIHEISHGFGAGHDDDGPCGNVRGKLMQSVVDAGISQIPGFSQCSISDIKNKINSAECLTASSGSITPSTSATPSTTPAAPAAPITPVVQDQAPAYKPSNPTPTGKDSNGMIQRLIADLGSGQLSSTTLSDILALLPSASKLLSAFNPS